MLTSCLVIPLSIKRLRNIISPKKISVSNTSKQFESGKRPPSLRGHYSLRIFGDVSKMLTFRKLFDCDKKWCRFGGLGLI